MNTRIIPLKIKIKSLAAEASIIRSEEERLRGRARAELVEHRCKEVRTAARHAQLAYGFLRGRPYHAIESRSTRNLPDWEEVRRLVRSFGSRPWLEPQRREQARRLDAWISAAEEVLGEAA